MGIESSTPWEQLSPKSAWEPRGSHDLDRLVLGKSTRPVTAERLLNKGDAELFVPSDASFASGVTSLCVRANSPVQVGSGLLKLFGEDPDAAVLKMNEEKFTMKVEG